MVHNNKVLTVSYGTFSCTLEGFEDSFDTMKAIAEYFRDLAADDRYFGAEPPQPDAEMLARIAQKEIARQVEARTSDEGIHLRAAVPAAAPIVDTPVEHAAEPAAAQPTAQPASVAAPLVVEKAAAEGNLAETPVNEAPELAVAETGAEPQDEAAPAPEGTAAETETTLEDIAELGTEAAPQVEVEVEELISELSAEEETTAEIPAETTAEAASEVAADSAVDSASDAAAPLDKTEDKAEDEAEPDAESQFDAGSDAEAAAWGVEEALTDLDAAAEDEHIVIPDAEEEPLPVAQSIAAKLQRIRAVVAKAPAKEEDFNEDQHADVFGEGSEFLEETVRDLEDVLGDAGEDSLAGDEALPEDTQSASDLLDELPSAVETEAREETEDASGQALLEDQIEDRIAAALAEDPAPAETNDGASDISAADPEPVVEHLADQTAETAIEPVIADAAASEPEITQADEAPETPAAEPAAKAAVPPEARRPRGRIIRVRRAAADANLVEASAEEVVSAETSATESSAAPAADLQLEPQSEPQSEPKLPPKAEPAPKPVAESSLSDADEADLMAELAAVEADLMAASQTEPDTPTAQHTEPTEADLDAGLMETLSEGHLDLDAVLDEGSRSDGITETAAPAANPSSRPAQQMGGQTLDSDLSRLLAAADDKLEEAEATSSRETYNQLRAAVAAAQAEKGELDTDAASEAEAYRNDLESVVRPRRPLKPRQTADARPADTPHAAPLKLVAEQRIDPADAIAKVEDRAADPSETKAAPDPVIAQPVQPRRVSRGMASRKAKTAGADGNMGFAEFVKEQGAIELGELLEAAATYLTSVEGRGQFTRPQLLGKVRDLDTQSTLTREDSLRAFGQLLREGKLDKAENGRFTTTSQTGFQPGTRVAG